ncbi:uncharacterized protein L3040_002809 [Drepanopeziza brunnea f. sp. 'multigermtubi']|nr:hypothetical protein L3040_002809 [Drepanopeziza brunnea f. sp. 'multigermtubi']
MEEAAKSLDGSSIKPVSSLRSHFEQMAKSKPKPPPPPVGPKPISPQLTGNGVSHGARDISRPGSTVQHEEVGYADDALRVSRGRKMDKAGNELRPPRTASADVSPSPKRFFRPRPLSTITPAVTIQPPQSPPKANTANLVLPHTPAYLSTDSPISASSGSASSMHFRIPSRPITPHMEPGRFPKPSSSRPPSPPPPRRSGEFSRRSGELSRREITEVLEGTTKSKAPPVNRADKPKISSKPILLSPRNEATKLEPGPRSMDRSSPFSTPPSSGGSPEHEFPMPALSRTSPWNAAGPRSAIEPLQSAHKIFDPPPVHHSVVTRRKDHETNGPSRGLLSPQATGEQRPALPTRPQAVPEPTKARGYRDVMPPPPVRPSMDRSRPPITTTTITRSIPEEGPLYPIPPKRVSSSPTAKIQLQRSQSQLHTQTPTRHGRSMTVDRNSDRAPIEFRTPITNVDPRQSLDISSANQNIKEAEPGEFPDLSHSNRRIPRYPFGMKELPTKYDTRILDICGEYVCTTGNYTRVWSLVDGEMLMSLAHTEGVRMVSVAFKPTADVADEGTRLWLGNNGGDLFEYDVHTQALVATKNAHTRRDVVKIHRHLNEMWTLDDGGCLHLWGPDSTGSPSLSENPSRTFRIQKGHTFSMVVVHELWVATGKDIRVYAPTTDGSSQWMVLQGTLNQPSAGEITSGATVGSLSDRVYFGHTDGKISIYSRSDYACLGILTISPYKITALAGAGPYLWAGFSTGAIYVYDTKPSTWIVKKDWSGHQSQVVNLITDQRSCWTADRVQVVSLGQDNIIQLWDGLLEDDWIEHRMQSQEAQFSGFTPIKVLIMSWNAGASSPSWLKKQQHEEDANFFRDLFRKGDLPDMVVFGFQELVDLEDKKIMTKTIFKSSKKKVDPATEQEHMSKAYRDWTTFLQRCMDDTGEIYQALHNSKLVGLYTLIFVKGSLKPRIRSLDQAQLKRGLGGHHGNKGALIVRFVLDDTSMCFVNCHLAAGQSQSKDRTADLAAIFDSHLLLPVTQPDVLQDSYVGGGDGSMVLDHEICVLNGDLNYRIDTMGTQGVVSLLKKGDLAKLLTRDQLLMTRRRQPWHKVQAFREGPITFAPTYKYDVGTDKYDSSEKKRVPAWCDRVLYRGGDGIKQLDYRREELHLSDHRPVVSEFEIKFKSISPERRSLKWTECLQDRIDRKRRLIREARQHYLIHYLGFDEVNSKNMIAHLEKMEKERAEKAAAERDRARNAR